MTKPAANPACQSFIHQLSPYIDGELTPSERAVVERHLSACKSCTALVADLRAESGLIRVGLDMAADEADFSDFAQKVMARITPEKPPLFERFRISVSELFTYERRTFVTIAATAAVVMLVVVPLALRGGTPTGYAQDVMQVERVSTAENATVAPVVMEPEGGATIIWVVDRAPEKKKNPEDLDEESEEELGIQPPPSLPNQERPRSGDL